MSVSLLTVMFPGGPGPTLAAPRFQEIPFTTLFFRAGFLNEFNFFFVMS